MNVAENGTPAGNENNSSGADVDLSPGGDNSGGGNPGGENPGGEAGQDHNWQERYSGLKSGYDKKISEYDQKLKDYETKINETNQFLEHIRQYGQNGNQPQEGLTENFTDNIRHNWQEIKDKLNRASKMEDFMVTYMKNDQKEKAQESARQAEQQLDKTFSSQFSTEDDFKTAKQLFMKDQQLTNYLLQDASADLNQVFEFFLYKQQRDENSPVTKSMRAKTEADIVRKNIHNSFGSNMNPNMPNSQPGGVQFGFTPRRR